MYSAKVHGLIVCVEVDVQFIWHAAMTGSSGAVLLLNFVSMAAMFKSPGARQVIALSGSLSFLVPVCTHGESLLAGFGLCIASWRSRLALAPGGDSGYVPRGGIRVLIRLTGAVDPALIE